MHFVDYDQLSRDPGTCFQNIYDFLGQPGFAHDFDRVEQLTHEDDRAYGFDSLHTIRETIAPQPPQWNRVYNESVFKDPVWKDVEKIAQFWKQWVPVQSKKDH